MPPLTVFAALPQNNRYFDYYIIDSIKTKWKIEKKLKETLEALIDNGYCYFGAGGALGFDTIAAQTVLGLKKKHPEIKLILVLPCKNQTRGWEEKDVSVYESIIEQADKVVYTQEHYDRGCMFKRNRHLVDNSSVCVAYLTEEKGGTAYTVNYANQKGVKVINIAE